MGRAVVIFCVIAPLFAQAENSAPPLGADPGQVKKRDQLIVENQVKDEALRLELAEANAELTRLKTNTELERVRVEQELVRKRNELERTRVEIEQINTRTAMESARRQAETQAQLIELRRTKERAEMEAELAVAQFTKQNSEFKSSELAWNSKLAELRARVAEREKQSEVDAYAEQSPIYLKDPLTATGELVLSDRRIPLNGVITADTADEVSTRIDYFNNKNKEWPIFIVIDDSPGGSVMAGYKILKSMQSSTAPVYVLVKSFAASMAAAITTLAERSFAYPNAIILHHQISNGMMGNLTVQREGVKTLEQWWQRLAAPIATKMGLTMDEFVKQMYAHSATGDWKEFADDAVKLKWVDTVVGRCHETACIRPPDREASAALGSAESSSVSTPAKSEPKTVAMKTVPRLNPVDCYYLYNPDGYYHAE
jgi:ATP-dependent Clp protease protease subunit